MAKDINTLRAEAQQVQNATQIGENTAQRVGGVLTDIVDKLGTFNIVQKTGNSTSDVMSQKAVTDVVEELTTSTRKNFDTVNKDIESLKQAKVVGDAILRTTNSMYFNYIFDQDGDTDFEIWGDFAGGSHYMVVLKVLSLEYQGEAGQANIILHDVDNDIELAKIGSTGEVSVAIPNDTTTLRLYAKYAPAVQNFEASVDFMYGTAALASDVEKNNQVRQLINGISGKLSGNGDHINIKKPDYSDFKKGDIVRLDLSEIVFNGVGNIKFYFGDIFTFTFDVNNRAKSYTHYIEIPSDIQIITLKLETDISVKNTSLTYNLNYYSALQEVANKSTVAKYFLWDKSMDYLQERDAASRIYYPFKKGETLLLNVKNSKINNVTNRNCSIRVSTTYTGEEEAVSILEQIHDGYLYCQLTQDVDYVDVSMYNYLTGYFTCDVELYYGKSAEDFIKDNARTLLADAKDETSEYHGISDDTQLLSTVPMYVGYERPFSSDRILKSLKIASYGAQQKNLIGTQYDFVVGTMAADFYFVQRIAFTSQVKDQMKDELWFDFSEDRIIVKKGEVLFVKLTPLDGQTICEMTAETYDEYNRFLSTNDITKAITFEESHGLTSYELVTAPVETIFTLKDKIDDLQEQISLLQYQISLSKILIDRTKYIAGNEDCAYRIEVSNNEIALKPLPTSDIKVLILGYGFYTGAGSLPDIGWNLSDNQVRSLTASTNNADWVSIMGLNGDVTCDTGSLDNVPNDIGYNYVIVMLDDSYYGKIGFGVITLSLLSALFKYPNSKIFLASGLRNNILRQELLYLLSKGRSGFSDIDFVDLKPYSKQTPGHSTTWQVGDYYDKGNGNYYPITSELCGYLNDKGQYDMAKLFMGIMNVREKDNINIKLYDIQLNQTLGGTIETPNVEWPNSGLVTIRCIPNDGYTIQSISVQDPDDSSRTVVTARLTNNYYDGTERVYYVFTMPKGNVVVTPTWVKS